jgi:hypothetical protein
MLGMSIRGFKAWWRLAVMLTGFGKKLQNYYRHLA